MPTATRLLAALGAAAAAALCSQLVMVEGAQAQGLPSAPYQATPAQAGASLPPPPYAAQPYAGQPYAGQPSGASPTYGATPRPTAQAYDRYGSGAVHAAAPVAQYGQPVYGQAAAAAGPRLSWGGKVEAAPPAPAPVPVAAPAYAYAGGRVLYPSMTPAAPPAAQATGARSPTAQARPDAAPQAQAPRGWAFVPPVGQPSAQASAPASAPTSIYDPPPPPAQPAAQAAADPQAPRPAQALAAADGSAGPRHYSVHRDYGIEPDPVPLPPQFFGATADLSQPATADPVRRTTTANGKTQNALQPEGGQ